MNGSARTAVVLLSLITIGFNIGYGLTMLDFINADETLWNMWKIMIIFHILSAVGSTIVMTAGAKKE